MGLPTVYGIVMQHGDSVQALSEPGHGMSFEILLPRLDAQAERP